MTTPGSIRWNKVWQSGYADGNHPLAHSLLYDTDLSAEDIIAKLIANLPAAMVQTDSPASAGGASAEAPALSSPAAGASVSTMSLHDRASLIRAVAGPDMQAVADVLIMSNASLDEVTAAVKVARQFSATASAPVLPRSTPSVEERSIGASMGSSIFDLAASQVSAGGDWKKAFAKAEQLDQAALRI